MSEQPASVSGLVPSETFEFTEADALDTIFDLLSSPRRRHVLRCLDEYDDPLALADLADEVAVREYDRPLTETSPEEVKRIYVSLYHTHVPKLEDAGVVEYNQERDLVSLASDRLSLDEYVDALS